jgi:hypothetical protein
VTWRGPNLPKWPGVKSSKVSVVIYSVIWIEDCGGRA